MGCYEDSMILLRFVFNLGDYWVSRMIFGFCMYLCGNFIFSYVGLRDDNICLCFNFMVNVIECFWDLCLFVCFGVGNFKCGGGFYLFVYKLV